MNYWEVVSSINYPLLQENVELRNQEREHLYHAVLAPLRDEKEKSLQHFIALREKRKSIVGEHFDYEAMIETVEGPAWYIELNAYVEKSQLPYHHVIEKYGESLLNKRDSSLNLRRSCYSSGLFLCLLLDEASPEWQEHFFDYAGSLYDFFKQYFAEEIMPVDDVMISQETVDIVKEVIDAREIEFQHFKKREGYHLYIDGEMTTKGIDPMNLIPGENKLLHRNFVKVEINDDEFLFQQPVITYFKDNHRNINKLHVILDEQPVETKGFLQIKGIGEIQGHLIERDDGFYLVVE